MIRADSNTRRTSSGSAQAESVRALYDLGPDWHEWHRRYIDGRGTCVCGARRGRRRQIWFPTRAPARSAPAREQEHADAPAGGTVTPDRDAGQTVHTAIDPTLKRPRHAPRRSACATGLHGRTRQTTETYDTLPRRRLLPRTVISPQPSHSHCTARNEEARRRNPCNSCNRTPDSRNASYYDSPLSCRCPL